MTLNKSVGFSIPVDISVDVKTHSLEDREQDTCILHFKINDNSYGPEDFKNLECFLNKKFKNLKRKQKPVIIISGSALDLSVYHTNKSFVEENIYLKNTILEMKKQIENLRSYVDNIKEDLYK